MNIRYFTMKKEIVLEYLKSKQNFPCLLNLQQLESSILSTRRLNFSQIETTVS